MCNGGGCLINPNGGGNGARAAAPDDRGVEVVVPFTRPTNLDRFLTAMTGDDGVLMWVGGGG